MQNVPAYRGRADFFLKRNAKARAGANKIAAAEFVLFFSTCFTHEEKTRCARPTFKEQLGSVRDEGSKRKFVELSLRRKLDYIARLR